MVVAASRDRVSRKNFASFIFFLLLAASVANSKYSPRSILDLNKRFVFNKRAALVATSVFLLQLSNNAKSSAAQEVDRDEFRNKYPYVSPQDFLNYLDVASVPGNWSSVVIAMDLFASVYPMYKLSPKKAMFLGDLVCKSNPSRVLEIGSFFGYSALHILRELSAPSNKYGNGTQLTCIEGNEENVRVAKAVLSRVYGENIFDDSTSSSSSSTIGATKTQVRVKFITGISTPVLRATAAEERWDFVFMDHDKNCYLSDLQLLESRSLLSDKCVVVADNVVFPGAPDFVEYIFRSPQQDEIARGSRKWTWKSRIEMFPFERVGFETNFKQQMDGLSVSEGSVTTNFT